MELTRVSTTALTSISTQVKAIMNNETALKSIRIPRTSKDKVAYNREKLESLRKHLTRPYLTYLLFDNQMINDLKEKVESNKTMKKLELREAKKIANNLLAICGSVRQIFEPVVDEIIKFVLGDYEYDFQQMDKKPDKVSLKLRRYNAK